MADEDRNGSDQRPSPEALLAEVGQEGRGRLKIFLGAAPGVGKTYEMLTSARRRKLDGVDVVVGSSRPMAGARPRLCWPGSRSCRAAGCPIAAASWRRWTSTALLKRRPQLALVDELAHDNAPGSRHPKRWMDVQELLAAGIDVWTTMNVQHVESLNDVVAQITHVRVRETVPDSVLDQAEIELIDLTPDELRERLHEGKVYVPEAAAPGARPLFQPRQPHRPARAGAAADGRARRRPDGPVHARARPRRPLGRAASACWPACMAARVRPSWSATPSGWPTACARPGRRSTSRPPATGAPARPPTTGWPTRCAWPSAWAARPWSCPASGSPRRSWPGRAPTTSPRSSSAACGARAGATGSAAPCRVT